MDGAGPLLAGVALWFAVWGLMGALALSGWRRTGPGERLPYVWNLKGWALLDAPRAVVLVVPLALAGVVGAASLGALLQLAGRPSSLVEIGAVLGISAALAAALVAGQAAHLRAAFRRDSPF